MKKRFLTIVAVLVLAAVLAVSLVACIPSDPEKAKANLEDEGFFVLPELLTAPFVAAVSLAAEGFEEMICAADISAEAIDQGQDPGEMIFILYFDSSDNAKAFYEGDIIQELKEEVDKDGTAQLKKQGKIVYIGTEAAIKAAK